MTMREVDHVHALLLSRVLSLVLCLCPDLDLAQAKKRPHRSAQEQAMRQDLSLPLSGLDLGAGLCLALAQEQSCELPEPHVSPPLLLTILSLLEHHRAHGVLGNPHLSVQSLGRIPLLSSLFASSAEPTVWLAPRL